MRAVFVVGRFPFHADFAHLFQGREQVGIEYFISIAFVEPFNERVLVRPAKLDVSDIYAVSFAPVYSGLDTELGTIVATNRGWLAAYFNRSTQLGTWDKFRRMQ